MNVKWKTSLTVMKGTTRTTKRPTSTKAILVRWVPDWNEGITLAGTATSQANQTWLIQSNRDAGYCPSERTFSKSSMRLTCGRELTCAFIADLILNMRAFLTQFSIELTANCLNSWPTTAIRSSMPAFLAVAKFIKFQKDYMSRNALEEAPICLPSESQHKCSIPFID